MQKGDNVNHTFQNPLNKKKAEIRTRCFQLFHVKEIREKYELMVVSAQFERYW